EAYVKRSRTLFCLIVLLPLWLLGADDDQQQQPPANAPPPPPILRPKQQAPPPLPKSPTAGSRAKPGFPSESWAGSRSRPRPLTRATAPASPKRPRRSWQANPSMRKGLTSVSLLACTMPCDFPTSRHIPAVTLSRPIPSTFGRRSTTWVTTY